MWRRRGDWAISPPCRVVGPRARALPGCYHAPASSPNPTERGDLRSGLASIPLTRDLEERHIVYAESPLAQDWERGAGGEGRGRHSCYTPPDGLRLGFRSPPAARPQSGRGGLVRAAPRPERSAAQLTAEKA